MRDTNRTPLRGLEALPQSVVALNASYLTKKDAGRLTRACSAIREAGEKRVWSSIQIDPDEPYVELAVRIPLLSPASCQPTVEDQFDYVSHLSQIWIDADALYKKDVAWAVAAARSLALLPACRTLRLVQGHENLLAELLRVAPHITELEYSPGAPLASPVSHHVESALPSLRLTKLKLEIYDSASLEIASKLIGASGERLLSLAVLDQDGRASRSIDRAVLELLARSTCHHLQSLHVSERYLPKDTVFESVEELTITQPFKGSMERAEPSTLPARPALRRLYVDKCRMYWNTPSCEHSLPIEEHLLEKIEGSPELWRIECNVEHGSSYFLEIRELTCAGFHPVYHICTLSEQDPDYFVHRVSYKELTVPLNILRMMYKLSDLDEDFGTDTRIVQVDPEAFRAMAVYMRLMGDENECEDTHCLRCF